MTMRVLADDQSSTPAPAPQHRDTQRRPDSDAAAEALAQWKAEGVQLPRTVHPQTTVGAAELRAVALKALNVAGMNTDATGPAKGLTGTALSALSAESVRTGVVDASYEGVVLPELHETALLSGKHATLQVHSRLVEPRLTGLSDDVTMSNQRAMIPGTGSEFQTGESIDTVLAVSGELKTTNGSSETVRNPSARFGDFDAKAAFAQSESFGSEVGSARQEGAGDSGRTGVVTYDVEYRIIATVDGRTAVLDVHRSRSGQIRVAQVDLEGALGGRSVPSGVTIAQDTVKKESDAWRAKEREVEKAQRDFDDLVNANAAVRAREEEALRLANLDVEDALERRDAARKALADLENEARRLEDAEIAVEFRFGELAVVLADLPSNAPDAAMQAELDQLDTRLAEVKRDQAALPAKLAANLPGLRADLARAEAVLTMRREFVEEAATAVAKLQRPRDLAAAKIQSARDEADAARTRWWNAKLELERRIEAFNDAKLAAKAAPTATPNGDAGPKDVDLSASSGSLKVPVDDRGGAQPRSTRCAGATMGCWRAGTSPVTRRTTKCPRACVSSATGPTRPLRCRRWMSFPRCTRTTLSPFCGLCCQSRARMSSKSFRCWRSPVDSGRLTMSSRIRRRWRRSD